MTQLARFLLLLTSLAPILLVYAAVLFEGGALWAAIASVSCALVMLLSCWYLLFAESRTSATDDLAITDPVAKESDPVSFLVVYALPLIALKPDDQANALAVAVFVVIMSLVVWQQQLFHINPLLALLGYRFFKAKNDSGAEVLVLTRRKLLAPGRASFNRLSDYFWLEGANHTHQNDGEEE